MKSRPASEWFPERLVEALRVSGYSQRAAAAKLGVKESTISGWKSARSKPDIDQLAALGDLFTRSTDWLLGRESEAVTPALAADALPAHEARRVEKRLEELEEDVRALRGVVRRKK